MTEPNDKAGEQDSGIGIWFNKRQVARIDFKVDHQMCAHYDGWRVEALSDGYLRFTMVDGSKEVILVRSKDRLLSSGEDFYIQRHRDDDRRRARK